MSSKIELWKEEEINIIKKYYTEFGPKYCSKLLNNRTIRSCKEKAKKLNIKYDFSFKYNEINIKNIILNSFNYKECLIKLNLSPKCAGNYNTLKRYIKLYNIDISHFKNDINYVNNLKLEKSLLKDILIENSTYTSTSSLKKRLYKEGLKERKCELCGQDENWNGKHMSLILDHINGVRDDNRIENLRIVCPNCNATLDTHCRGNVKLKQKIKTKELKYEREHKKCECGNTILISSSCCSKCYHEKTRKVKDRPSIEQLEQDIKELGYCGTGRKYGVSDNTIRKWIKN